MSARNATSAKKLSRITAPILVNSAEVEIMRALRRQGRISRGEISNITGWSKAKASQEIRSLVNKGYLVEIGEGVSQGGRKPRLLRINNQLGFIAGIDIGATSIDIAVADVSGLILQRRSEPADVKLSPESVLGRCSELLLELIQEQKVNPHQILGIGIGVPGPVDFARGVLVAPPLMPEWENFPIRDFFKKTFTSAFVVVDNDVNIMALGEQRAGDGAGIDHFIFVKIGTGIGAGIVSNGKIHRASDGSAGDIGHICVDKNGPLCACGNTGCLEAMTAGPSISLKAIEAALLLAIILFILSGLLPNGFGSDLNVARAQATNILHLAVFLGVIAAGQTLVIISGSEGIDLSAGSVVTLTAILTYILVNGIDARVLPALLVSLAVGALVGFVNGVGITFLKISPFVMTLGMSGVVTGAIIVITHGSVSGKISPLMTRLIARPLSPALQIPNAIIIWILFGILMWMLLERTTFGRNLFAIGVNRITARLSGVNVAAMNLATYALAGALAGFGGFLLVGNTGVVHLQLGQPFLFPSIAAVAVGGTLLSGGKGSYWGTMAGAIVLTLITSLLTTMQMPDSVRRMVLGGILLILISIYGRQRALRQ